MSFKHVLSKFLSGDRKTAIFALTTQCNCKCIMCNMHKQKPEHISLDDSQRILDFLSENRFLTVYFTGGEPTLHPKLTDIVRYADKVGLVTSITTNGTCSKETILRLKNAGLYNLSVSLDHWDAELCEKIRGYRGIKTKEEEIITYAKDIGLRVYALAFLNPFLIRDGVENLVKHVNLNLGVPFGFCYPTQCETNSFQLGSTLSEDELCQHLAKSIEKIFHLKKKRGFKIVNPSAYLEDILRSYAKRKPNFYCKGGKDVVYIDWRGDVYPCFLKTKIFNLLNGDKPNFLEKVACNECLINCFREPSLLPYSLSSPKLFLKEASCSHSIRDMIF
ncbi:MAG: radical SAM protein [Candidatus Bathyarchaeota archaeon]